MSKLALVLTLLASPQVLAAEPSESRLSRCAVYLQAHASLVGADQEVVEDRNASALRALNQFRTANLSEFDFSPGDEPVAFGTQPSEALAHRLSAIINRDGFKLGRQNMLDGGLEAAPTRVLADIEEGEASVRRALAQRQVLASISSSGKTSGLFGPALIDEPRLLAEMERLQPGQWFYHSFDVAAPTEVAEALWRTGQVPRGLLRKATSSVFASLIKGIAELSGAAVEPGENTEVLRVDELLVMDRYSGKPILITILRLAQASDRLNQGGGGSRRVIELRDHAGELAEELEAQGLKPIKATRPRRP